MLLRSIFELITLLIIPIAFFLPVVFLIYLYLVDRRQKQHSVLRNFPVLGRVRYFLEMIGPELRQYLFLGDNDGLPISRSDFVTIVKSSKMQSTLIGFGSNRNFDRPGFYIRNSLFPTLTEELRTDHELRIRTRKYVSREGLFFRRDRSVVAETNPWLLAPEDEIVVGPEREIPFRVRGQIGMSAISYGALGKNAITALSLGLGAVPGTWMNTGEGGISSYHLKGDVDLIAQIGPGLFGFRTLDGKFSWEELKKKAALPAVRAFELKLAQGAKIRGGHLEAQKVTPDIAAIRNIVPFQTVDSPNRFREFHDVHTLLQFIKRIQEESGKPVGIKIVVGDGYYLENLVRAMYATGTGPDFITVDGGEGGSGATYSELADSVGLPVKSAIPIVDNTLRKYGLRDRVKIIASGKLYTPDRAAVALAMGADLIQIARGFMISIGCIMAHRCHTNECPVGVATTDPRLERALSVDEKKDRVTNYVIAMRQGLFHLAAAAGLGSPVEFRREHVVYQDEFHRVISLSELHPYPESTLTSEKPMTG